MYNFIFASSFISIVACTAQEGGETANDEDVNVLVFKLETFRRDFMDSTPEFAEGLTSRGFLVPHVWNVASWTHPTSAATDSGRWMRPEAWDLRDWEIPDEEIETIAEILGVQGWDYRYFNCGNTVACGESNLDQGYTEVDDQTEDGRNHPTFVEQASELKSWLGRVPSGKRWFSHIHTYHTHAPYMELDDSCAENAQSIAATCPFEFDYANEQEIFDAEQTWSDVEREACYNAAEALNRCEAVAFTNQFLVLIRDLQEAGYLENTIVAIYPDHGEEYGPIGHNKSVTVGQVAGFAWIVAPGFYDKSPGTYAYAASQIDFLPTILDLAGVTAGHFDGVSLVNRDEPVGHPVTSFWCLGESGERAFSSVSADGSQRLILNKEQEYELYNPLQDPEEKQNLIESSVTLPANLVQDIEDLKVQMSDECHPS